MTVEQTFQILGFIFEGIGLIAGLTIAFLVLRKDSKYIGNRLMAISMVFFGLYMGSILLYDIFYPIFQQDWLIEVFFRICLIAILFGSMFLFFTIQVSVKASIWFTFKRVAPYVLVLTAYSIWIWFYDFITIISGDQVNTQAEMIPTLLLLILSVLYFIIRSIVGIYRFGIRKTEGERKKKMITFFMGLIISLAAIIINVLSNILDDPIGVLDVFFFGILALAMVIMALGLTRKPEE